MGPVFAASAAKTGTNALRGAARLKEERRISKENIHSYRLKSSDILKKQKYDEGVLRRESDEDRGESVARSGASGVKVSSFDDAFLSHDLKTEQEAAMRRYEADSEVSELNRRIRSERRANRARNTDYGLGVLSDLFGLAGKYYET